MKSTFSIAFYCRRSRANKKGLAPIEMSVSLHGERVMINLPLKTNPESFDKMVASKKTNEVKNYLSLVESKMNSLQVMMASANRRLTTDLIREYVRGGFQFSYSLGELWSDYSASLQKKGTTPRNERKYELVIESFYAQILPPETQVSDIQHRHILDFESYLKGQFADSTAANMLSKMRSIILYAINNGKIDYDPFRGIRINKRLKEVEFLTFDEIDKIREKQMPNDRLERVKDIFLFQCFTALSYCDMAALVPNDFQRNDMGQMFLRKNRAKTRTEFCTVLFEDAKAIAEKYQYRLPVLSNQRYNSYLKEIAAISPDCTVFASVRMMTRLL
ncbi:MAG: phage integrase SAM-like domain-containing protein [Bacteroidales bacterium]